MYLLDSFSKKHFPRTVIVAAISSAILVACGGSSGTGASSKLVSGTITGFGSIHVEGNHILTDSSTTYSVDGTNDDGSSLNVGDSVDICTTVNANGELTATEVISNDELQGVVTLIPTGACPASGAIEVMGKVVNYNTASMTLEGATDVCSLVVGTTKVEVQGTPGVNGIDATRIEVKTVSDSDFGDDEIKGIAGTVDASTPTASTVVVDSMTITFDSTSVNHVPATGDLIEAKLSSAPSETSPGVWIATASEIQLEDNSPSGCGTNEGDEAEIKGIVTRGLGDAGDSNANPQVAALNANQFEINGSQIVELASSIASNPDILAMIIVSAQVEIDGSYDSTSVLIAEKVDTELEADSSESGTVSSVTEKVAVATGSSINDDPANYDPKTIYTVTLASGNTYEVDPLNVIFDDNGNLSVGDTQFDLTDLIGAGIQIEVKFDTATMVATKIELRSQL